MQTIIFANGLAQAIKLHAVSSGFRRHLLVTLLTVGCLGAVAVAADEPATTTSSVDMDKRMREFRDLKWGMYLCWSFCCFSGKQWTPNVKDISLFNPSGCDTDQWARTAKEAGMGVICFLTKHHDGFCLWDTDTSDRKVTKSPLGVDVLAKMRKSCDKYGIKLALYYSESEWRWPGAIEGQAYHNGINPQMKKAQLKELLTRYGPIEYMWIDNAIGDGGLSHQETVKWIKRFQPRCLVGFNCGQAAGDLQIGEDGRPAPMDRHKVVCPYMGNNPIPAEKWDPSYKGYLIAEILQPMIAEPEPLWFYDPAAGDNCRSAQDLYATYLGAMKYGLFFELGISPNRAGQLRKVDVATLRRVGEMIQNPPKPRPPSLSTGKPATASSVWRSEYDASKAVDNDDTSFWAATPGARSGWLEVDLGREEKIGVAEICERFSFPSFPIKQFAIEYKYGNEWKVALRGTTIGIQKTVVFSPVIARYVRLNVLKADPVNNLLVIEEFRLWPPRK
jgi:alpha-L-fucosidase